MDVSGKKKLLKRTLDSLQSEVEGVRAQIEGQRADRDKLRADLDKLTELEKALGDHIALQEDTRERREQDAPSSTR